MQRVTIKDVALAAGVQPSTVSYILNNSRKGFSQDTVSKVKLIAQQMGYKPDAAARSLRGGATEMIGFLFAPQVDVIQTNLDYQLMSGIAVQGQEKKYDLALILVSSINQPDFSHLEHVLDSRRVDGLILSNPIRGSNLIPFLIGRSVPFVIIGRPSVEGVNWVDNDNIKIGYLQTRHLAELGHRKIAFLTPGSLYAYAADREQGFMQVCSEYGINEYDAPIVICEDSREGAEKAITELYKSNNKPTAICAVDDRLAEGAISAIRKIGKSVPEDISIIGCNNLPHICDRNFLTTIELGMPQLGRLAAKKLLNILSGNNEKIEQTIDGKLVIRKSTSPFAQNL